MTETEYEGMQAFRLAGATRLAKESWDSSGGPNPVLISAELEANEKRLMSVASLLDRKQLDEARRVLDEVTGDAPHGRATALRGKLAALQGDCATALKLFDQAELEIGPGCAPLDDRQLCKDFSRPPANWAWDLAEPEALNSRPWPPAIEGFSILYSSS
jgi:hypothetical protein